MGKGLTHKVGLQQRPEGTYGNALHIFGGGTFQTEVNSKSKALRWDGAGSVGRSVWLESSERKW